MLWGPASEQQTNLGLLWELLGLLASQLAAEVLAAQLAPTTRLGTL